MPELVSRPQIAAGYWGRTTRTYHHTAPTNSLYALHESLLALQQEGLEQAWARHQSNHIALKMAWPHWGSILLLQNNRACHS